MLSFILNSGVFELLVIYHMLKMKEDGKKTEK
jgi:hypothetical protein